MIKKGFKNLVNIEKTSRVYGLKEIASNKNNRMCGMVAQMFCSLHGTTNNTQGIFAGAKKMTDCMGGGCFSTR